MCGIAGFLQRNLTEDQSSSVLVSMADALSRRGPDDKGYWFDLDAGVGLAHRRLSIIDLTSAGHQPMVSANGRFVMVLNGEAYNFQSLRERLKHEAHDLYASLRGHSDTEVLLAAIQNWGLECALRDVNGMFALALWDRKSRTLHLARDRVGIKPLYYGWHRGWFCFASELKALESCSFFKPEIDRRAVQLLMQTNHIPAPRTIYQGIQKLRPGTILTVNGSSASATETVFWSLESVTRKARSDLFEGSENEIVEQFESVLESAVARRMIADVELGALLSGGIDSSLIVAVMSRLSRKPVQTFCIGFDEKQQDERIYARQVSQSLGTHHHELVVTPTMALECVPDLSVVYDEPFADPSQIPTLMVSRLARKHVTVALSGDGGDEMCAGYNRYAEAQRLFHLIHKLPRFVNRMMTSTGLKRGLSGLDPILARTLLPLLSIEKGARYPRLSSMMARVGELAKRKLFVDFYALFMSNVGESENWILDDGFDKQWLEPSVDAKSPIESMMLIDTQTYLPDVILTKVDRASMSVGLEVRVPLLDHQLIEFFWRLPLELKIRNGKTKWILRHLLKSLLPLPITERPKQGFAVPIGDWIRGPLRAWADDLLSEQSLSLHNFIDAQNIRLKWHQHQKGTHNWQYLLWNVLMFQSWHKAKR